MPDAIDRPLTLRGLTLRNRLVVPPMCQYSASDGIAGDWHFAHLAKFALGGFGLVVVEATAVEARGRITHGDLGLWSDAQIAPLAHIAAFLKAHGAAAAIQLGHAGRKASMQRPWFGNGPLGAADMARGDTAWPIDGVTADPVGPGWLVPAALDEAGIARIVAAFGAAARRAVAAGFDAVEIHGAHGYLIHTFLSPLANRRADRYGGDLAGRMRFAVEVAAACRAAIPDTTPLCFKISAVDWEPGGWTLDESVALAASLRAAGVDVVICSSGGIAGPATAATVPRAPGYQVPFAARVRREAGVATLAVGLIRQLDLADATIARGEADLVGIAREALYDPFWPLHERARLGEADWRRWPVQYGWWLQRRPA